MDLKGMRILLAVMLFLLPVFSCAGEESCPVREYDFTGTVKRSYDSDTLKYTVEAFRLYGERCYLSKIWMRDPGKQIRKATSEWRKNLIRPVHLASQIPEAALVINGSGYVSPSFPWIPEDYPGKSKDYYYTPLGSLTITNGEVFRNLENVPYTGLTLEADGLHMYMGESTAKVLEANPVQTWSFYVQCPMILDDQILTPEDWKFAGRRNCRTVIARADRNNYLILSVTNEKSIGLSLHKVNEFLTENFDLEWAYNLDGGPSSALLCRDKDSDKLTTIAGGSVNDVDIMAFVELEAEQEP